MKDIECPYCGGEQDICNDDGHGCEEDETYEEECIHCGKTFVFTTYISFSYEAQKADCLNDGEHTYEPTWTIPREYTRMRCTQCDQERPCTKEEIEQILLKDKVNNEAHRQH